MATVSWFSSSFLKTISVWLLGTAQNVIYSETSFFREDCFKYSKADLYKNEA